MSVRSIIYLIVVFVLAVILVQLLWSVFAMLTRGIALGLSILLMMGVIYLIYLAIRQTMKRQ